MKKSLLTVAFSSSALLLAAPAFAYGPHTALDCLGCHDPHYAKAQKIFKVKNTIYPNPRTGQTIDDVSALCLGCHNIPQFGGAGIKPIHLYMTHPVNVRPNTRIANVPSKLLRSNKLQCVSCHDPHPSNPYWRYLRVDTEGGTKVGNFCQLCHPAKAEWQFYGQGQRNLKVFSSMNESVGAGEFKNAWDENFVANNPTPVYIQAFGDFPNSIAPAYPTVATQPWIFAPPEDKIPDQLKDAMAGKALAPNADQQKQIDYNNAAQYEEPHPFMLPPGQNTGDTAPQAQPADQSGSAAPAPAATQPDAGTAQPQAPQQ